MGVSDSKKVNGAQIRVVKGVSCAVVPCRHGEENYQVLHMPFSGKTKMVHGAHSLTNPEMRFITISGTVDDLDLRAFIKGQGMFSANLNHTASSLTDDVHRRLIKALDRKTDDTLVFFPPDTKVFAGKDTYFPLMMYSKGEKPKVNYISYSQIRNSGMHPKWICTACRSCS